MEKSVHEHILIRAVGSVNSLGMLQNPRKVSKT
jgi:hypothetical protein